MSEDVRHGVDGWPLLTDVQLAQALSDRLRRTPIQASLLAQLFTAVDLTLNRGGTFERGNVCASLVTALEHDRVVNGGRQATE